MTPATTLVTVLALLVGGAAAAAPPAPKQAPRALPTDMKPWKGDLDGMIERRMIRVLVPYSRTLYYNDKGRERGVTADLVREFEQHLNRKHAKQLGKRPITVYMIPTTRDELLKDVAEGVGDIAAGNLTITEARLKAVDFATPAKQRAQVSEVVVTGPKAAPVATAAALAGRTVHVRKASSYHESLVALNERLKKDGKKPAELVLVPDALEDEDMMEMANAGLLEAIVVDDWKARMWAQALPKVKVNEGAVVRAGSAIGWAIRKESPGLRRALEEFYADTLKVTGGQMVRVKQYASRVRQLQDPTRSADYKRFEGTLALFRKYGAQYGFDPLMLAAQGYQESTLDQNAKSHVGAIGIMQIMPATGKELAVGDIRIAENNVHGGAKYMDRLMTKFFADARFDEQNRSLFAFAAYNAGPGRIAQMRTEAAKRGLDPDKWFNNVELVTAEKVGIETTTYVRNIYKYYTAYKISTEVTETQRKAREQVAPKKG
jgi:membrane-bound lytic murein transglycosylase MltF